MLNPLGLAEYPSLFYLSYVCKYVHNFIILTGGHHLSLYWTCPGCSWGWLDRFHLQQTCQRWWWCSDGVQLGSPWQDLHTCPFQDSIDVVDDCGDGGGDLGAHREADSHWSTLHFPPRSSQTPCGIQGLCKDFTWNPGNVQVRWFEVIWQGTPAKMDLESSWTPVGISGRIQGLYLEVQGLHAPGQCLVMAGSPGTVWQFCDTFCDTFLWCLSATLCCDISLWHFYVTHCGFLWHFHVTLLLICDFFLTSLWLMFVTYFCDLFSCDSCLWLLSVTFLWLLCDSFLWLNPVTHFCDSILWLISVTLLWLIPLISFCDFFSCDSYVTSFLALSK